MKGAVSYTYYSITDSSSPRTIKFVVAHVERIQHQSLFASNAVSRCAVWQQCRACEMEFGAEMSIASKQLVQDECCRVTTSADHTCFLMFVQYDDGKVLRCQQCEQLYLRGAGPVQCLLFTSQMSQEQSTSVVFAGVWLRIPRGCSALIEFCKI
jgi:hypothetical protein